MSDVREEAEDWIAYYMPLAEAGDPDAQIAVGWEYFRGTIFNKDVDAAIDWFRNAESSVGELAIFNLIKMLYIEKDERISKIFFEKPEWDSGAIYLFYGSYLIKSSNENDGLKYLDIGGRKGSLVSALHFHQYKYKWSISRLLKLPYEISLALKAAVIATNNPKDLRILR